MAAIGAQILLQSVSNGCLTMHDTEIERRPYHRNCSCALHKSTSTCSKGCSQSKTAMFPKNQIWKDAKLSLATVKSSSNSHLISDSSSNHNEDQFRILEHR
ncbi:hypothetical protein QQ045_001662 [Rhodiola kirilowii]